MQEEDRWLFLPSLRQPTPYSRRRETSAAVRCKGEIFRPHTTRDGLECYHVLRVHVIKQRACSLLAAQSAQIGRQRPLQLESRVSPSGRASNVRMRKVGWMFWRTRLAHTRTRLVPA